MEITSSAITRICDEREIFEALPLARARVLELGCGNAAKTRIIASAGQVASVLALEVDVRQHGKNTALTDLPYVRFALGGAEQIPADDASFDIVFLFKSLHHVPLEKLTQAFAEIYRVLVPGGLVYISEPIFAGDYNEIMRLFHDEKMVREAAFSATREAIQSGGFQMVEQFFFKSLVRFRDFPQFEKNVINATHTDHQLSPDVLAAVREKFSHYMTGEGARFYAPHRVDLLRKPA
ncbi:class I SAM-dependent methyltransferase [Glaciimonas sp. PAMC28666]|uniref:class I SAM-dependent methyltransferase n=1 Tax=Glaciimonas sp. PAMC28666 TaxID=2807626 RepID=UPI001962E6A0|nr:class I SAM-dependent methyltransferase [Glaciimonas sp. PAMC28666]QRX83487.1 class I SAM-dependent methyltransferase [Glaciimonas sp. PAMC28666]